MGVIEFKKKSKETASTNNEGGILPPHGASAIGIDLGTTNSVVSIYSPDSLQPQTLSYCDAQLVPSIVYYDPKTKRNLVGMEAKFYLMSQPEDVIKSTKRSMGKLNPEPFVSNSENFNAEQVASLILCYLMSHPRLVDEKSKFGGVWAVITVPAHFDDAARQATIAAARSAGIFLLRIINEPTAAALAYSLVNPFHDNHERQNAKETVAVFDFGGGTFDVSVVDRNGSIFNVMSSEGDVNLGGDDVDSAIADFLLTKVQPIFVGRRTQKGSPLYRTLLEIAEKVKKNLQNQGSIHLFEENIDKKGSFIDVDLTSDTMEELYTSVIDKTVYLTERAMLAAKRSPKNISRILLVGGSTRLNLVSKALRNYFPCQVDGRLEPDLAVSWGASVQAAMILGLEVTTILVDVCSHTLGVGVLENGKKAEENFNIVARRFGFKPPILEQEVTKQLGPRLLDFNRQLQGLLNVAPILHRNSPLPARKSEFFNTIYNNQSAVNVVVVQGEHDKVFENRLIGSFLFQLKQPCPKGTRCEIQLTYDTSGMVHVFAKQLGTTNESEARFDSRTGEAQGWSPVGDISTNLKEETGDPKHHQVLRLIFGQKSEKQIKTPLDGPAESFIVNGVILKAKRYLSLRDQNSQEYLQMQDLLTLYTKYLREARDSQGPDDAAIEVIENQIMAAIEKEQANFK